MQSVVRDSNIEERRSILAITSFDLLVSLIVCLSVLCFALFAGRIEFGGVVVRN